MRTAVIMLSAVCSASLYAQAPAGRGAAPPPPPATETVAPAIPGVVAAGTKVAIVKDGLRSSEGPIPMPLGTTLFTEPGGELASTRFTRPEQCRWFLENTNRANGLALDSTGRLHRHDSGQHRRPAPQERKCSQRMPLASKRPRRRQEGRHLFHSAERQTVRGVLHNRRAGPRPTKLGEAASAHGIQLSPDEKTLDLGGFERRISHRVRRPQSDGKLTNKRNFGRYQGITEPF